MDHASDNGAKNGRDRGEREVADKKGQGHV